MPSGGMLLAKQEIYLANNSSAVKWRHVNPGSASWVETTAGRVFERQEMDPLGAEVGTFDPILITPDPYGDVHGDTPMFMDGGDPFHLSDGCGDIDGMPASCAEISERMANGTAVYEEWGGRSRAVPRQMTPSITAPGGQVSGSVWVDNWVDCAKPGEDVICQRNDGYFQELPGQGGMLATHLTPLTAGGGGSGRGRLNTGSKAKFDLKKFQTCLNDMFGITLGLSDGRTQALWFDRNKGGHFDGYMRGNKWFTINTDLSSYNSKQLGKMYEDAGGERMEQTGLTLGAKPKVNYIANNVAAWGKHTTAGLFGLFIHELGNALGANRFGIDAYSDYAEKNRGNGIKDPDAGAAFETCVFGGLVGLRSGRVGNDREFLSDAP